MNKIIENISNNVVKALIEEAENIKSTISKFKTVGDIQKEIEADSEISRFFQDVCMEKDNDDSFVEGQKIMNFDPTLPLYSICFSCLTDMEGVQEREEKLGEYKHILIENPTYNVENDDLEFQVYDYGHDYPVFEDFVSLSELKNDSSLLLDSVYEHITETEYEKDEER